MTEGTLSDNINSRIKENNAESWAAFKSNIIRDFADIRDDQHSLSILRKLCQEPQETAHIFGHRLKMTATELLEDTDLQQPMMIKELIIIYLKGIKSEHIRRKIDRKNLTNLEECIQVAREEEEKETRYQLRYGQESKTITQQEARHTNNHVSTPGTQEEFMEIDHIRQRMPQSNYQRTSFRNSSFNPNRQSRLCFRCGSPAHLARFCSQGSNNQGNFYRQQRERKYGRQEN